MLNNYDNQNQQNENSVQNMNQESGSFYHYSYAANDNQNQNGNAGDGNGSPIMNHSSSGKEPKRNRNRKAMALAVAAALIVGVAGGTVINDAYHSRTTDSAATAEAATENQEETEIARAVDSKAEVMNLSAETSTEEATEETTETSASQGEDMTVEEVAAYAMPGMVAITNKSVTEVRDLFFGQTYEQEEESTGTGVIIGENDDELLIATNNHVVEGAQDLTVCFSVTTDNPDDSVVTAEIKGTDPNHDLAVISVKLDDITDGIKDQIRIMEIGSSSDLALGEQVVAIGNALGYGQSVTSGYVSALNREIETEDGTTNTYIQTDAAINPGNSGGALLNMQGQLIGINSAKAAATGVEGMGYAIPIDTAAPIIDELENIETRELVDEENRGYLGIQVSNVSSEAREIYNIPSGAFVSDVTEGSAAETAGLKRGDIITKIDGVIITSSDDLLTRMEYYAEGDQPTLTIMRSNNGEYEEQEITVTLDQKPQDETEEAETSGTETPTTENEGYDSGSDNYGYGNYGYDDYSEGYFFDMFPGMR